MGDAIISAARDIYILRFSFYKDGNIFPFLYSPGHGQIVADRVSSPLSKSSVFHADSFHCISLCAVHLLLVFVWCHTHTRVVCYCVTAPRVRFYSAIHCYLPFLRGTGHRVANHFRSTNSSLFYPSNVPPLLSVRAINSDEILFHHVLQHVRHVQPVFSLLFSLFRTLLVCFFYRQICEWTNGKPKKTGMMKPLERKFDQEIKSAISIESQKKTK
jgi:hypothetical protein